MPSIRGACIKPQAATTDLSRLGLGERLLVSGLRRWIMGLQHREAWHWSRAWDSFAAELGPAPSREALRALDALVRELASAARRRFRYHHPCCPVLTADEVTVLSLAAACQTGAQAHRDALVRWLVRPSGFERLAGAAEDLAAALAAAGLRLAMPDAPGWGNAPRRRGDSHADGEAAARTASGVEPPSVEPPVTRPLRAARLGSAPDGERC